MRHPRKCQLIRQAKLAKRESIRKRRLETIAKFLEEQDISKFKISPMPKSKNSRRVSQPKELPKELTPDLTCEDSPNIDMSEELPIPSRSAKKLPTLTKRKRKRTCFSSRRKRNTTSKQKIAATPTTNKSTISKETQTDLVMTDAQERLLRMIMSQNTDVPNPMWTNNDYIPPYTNPSESYGRRRFNDNDIGGLLEHQAILSSMFGLPQQHHFNPVNPNPNRFIITELKDDDETEQKQDLQIEELPLSDVEETQQKKQAIKKSSTKKGGRKTKRK